jgi:hypothetical protein
MKEQEKDFTGAYGATFLAIHLAKARRRKGRQGKKKWLLYVR